MRNKNQYSDGNPCNLYDAYKIEQLVSNRLIIQYYHLIILFVLCLFFHSSCSLIFGETLFGTVCSLLLVFLLLYLLIQQFISCCETLTFKKRLSTLYDMMLKTIHTYTDSNAFLKDRQTWVANYQKQLTLNLMLLDQILSECKEYQSKQYSRSYDTTMSDIAQYVLDCIEQFEDESSKAELKLKNI